MKSQQTESLYKTSTKTRVYWEGFVFVIAIVTVTVTVTIPILLVHRRGNSFVVFYDFGFPKPDFRQSIRKGDSGDIGSMYGRAFPWLRLIGYRRYARDRICVGCIRADETESETRRPRRPQV